MSSVGYVSEFASILTGSTSTPTGTTTQAAPTPTQASQTSQDLLISSAGTDTVTTLLVPVPQTGLSLESHTDLAGLASGAADAPLGDLQAGATAL